MLFRTALIAAMSVSLVHPIAAHHSLAAEFDTGKPVVLTAAVTGIDWKNPHIWIYMDVRDDSGAVASWQCEMGSPNQLSRAGWKKDDVKAGDEIVVEGILAKDGSQTCSTRNMKFKDGRPLFSRSGR